ncbi:MAG: hypothetical protein JXK07_02440 [Spirochaetes bacterium]|nr:hypothetical protein [Spirochaetota bacterium]MBN2771016.1 hypothetical protein [Spirochaetota bacterium]
MKIFAGLLMMIMFIGCADDDAPVFADTPETVRIFTSDIDLFWIAYDKAFKCDTQEERVRVFQRDYVNTGSTQLRWMFENKFCLYVPLSYFVERIASAQPYYNAVRETTQVVNSDQMRVEFLDVLFRLEELYPEAVYPDMYFMIGNLSNGGTYNGYAVNFAIEAYLADEDTPLDGVAEDFIQFIQKTDYLPTLIAHEYVHVQQRYLPPDRDTLLAHSLIEGGANFIAELICQRPDNPTLYAYGDAHEEELWKDFEKVMSGYDFSGWLYSSSDVRPINCGYYIGYKICEAYYAKAPDKRQAISDMMNIKDGSAFLARSGYESKFL